MEAIKEYLTPTVELVEAADVITTSYNYSDIEKDENELPKLDW